MILGSVGSESTVRAKNIVEAGTYGRGCSFMMVRNGRGKGEREKEREDICPIS